MNQRYEYNPQLQKLPGYALIETQLEQVRSLLAESLENNSPKVLQDIIREFRSLFFGGKMLRPALHLLCGKCFGNLNDHHIRIAAALELFHTATLLHDDVIDNGESRRGLPTINRTHGNHTAILTGDFLLSILFRLCLDTDQRILREVLSMAQTTCEGELDETMRNGVLTEEAYFEIIKAKTAALFSCSCKLGAFLAEATPEQQQAMERFGMHFGIAFQIADDVIDLLGSETNVGKTLGTDLQAETITLPIIHIVNQQGKDWAKTKNEKSLSREQIADRLRNSGSIEYAVETAKNRIEQASRELDTIPAGDTRDALIVLSNFIVDRMPT